jgi:TolA-binding protein
MRRTSLTALVLIALFSNGCFLWTNREEGETLKQDVQHLKDRLVQVESENEEDRQRLTEMIERARTEVVNLEETLTRATRILARNSADFGAEMETLKDSMRTVDGSLAEIEHEIGLMGTRVDNTDRKVNEFALAAGLDLPVDESKVPAKAKEHFSMIRDSLATGRYGEVRSLAKLYIQRYPKDGKADDAQLMIGKSYLEQKRWAKALGALRRFTDRYPKSPLTPEVLYEMAGAFYKLGVCNDARILLDAVTSRYKSSPFAKKASKLQADINNNKARCTS